MRCNYCEEGCYYIGNKGPGCEGKVICEPCRLGADIMRFKRGKRPLNSGTYDDVSRDLHNQCKGGTHCDCQHRKSGSMINRAAVEERNRAQENSKQNSGVGGEAGD